MASNVHVHMGLIPFAKGEYVDKPGQPVDLGSEFGDRCPTNPSMLVTACWQTSTDVGFPVAPAIVRASTGPMRLPDKSILKRPELVLDPDVQGLESNLAGLVPAIGPDGLFCVVAIATINDHCEVFALDGNGDEIPETRQRASNGTRVVLLGPGIFGVRATSTLKLSNIVMVTLIEPNTDMIKVAEVGPCLPSACYQNQPYLDVVLNAEASLAVRLKADALARANTAPPDSGRLRSDIHQANPALIADKLLRESFVQQVSANLADVLAMPGWTYTEPVPDAPDASFQICPSAIWQAISLTGSVEAAILGQSVSFPVSEAFSSIRTSDEIYEWITNRNTIPFPMVQVQTFNAQVGFIDTGDADTNRAADRVATSTQWSRLILETELLVEANLTAQRAPMKHDGPASVDIRLSPDDASRLDTFYVETSLDREDFFEDGQKRLTAYFPSNDPIGSATGASTNFVAGPLDLPLSGAQARIFGIYARDVFGRWPRRGEPICELRPWPIQTPTFGQILITYADDGNVVLTTSLTWDWALRSPSDLRLGVVIKDAANDRAFSNDGSDETFQDGLPVAGIALPDQAPIHASILFDENDAPGWSMRLPNGFAVARINPAPPDPASQGTPVAGSQTLVPTQPPPDPRIYQVVIPLGPASAIFGQKATRYVGISVDALEKVSGSRRSLPGVRAMSRLDDPRPPVLDGRRWDLMEFVEERGDLGALHVMLVERLDGGEARGGAGLAAGLGAGGGFGGHRGAFTPR